MVALTVIAPQEVPVSHVLAGPFLVLVLAVGVWLLYRFFCWLLGVTEHLGGPDAPLDATRSGRSLSSVARRRRQVRERWRRFRASRRRVTPPLFVLERLRRRVMVCWVEGHTWRYSLATGKPCYRCADCGQHRAYDVIKTWPVERHL